MKVFILFVYLQVVPEGSNYYFIIFKKLGNGKLLPKFIYCFYERCLGSY